MLVVALTGNIASGKSTVADLLESYGAVVVDSDVLAREAVAPGSPALDAIAQRWGGSMLTSDGSLDRSALGHIVFADETERLALNAIVHPRVEALRRARVERARLDGASVVVCDIPLLFETGLDRSFDTIILVHASEAVRLERLISYRGLSRDDARRMMAAQLPSESKREQSQYVIDNDDGLDALRAKVYALWHTLRTRATASR